MAIPKIALIPSGVKAGKLYSVLPTNGDGDFTTTRNTVATRVNENGLIEEVASNVPRLDYSDGGCPSLLSENSSTNIITYSEDFSNGGFWSTTSATVATSTIVSPDGLQGSYKLVPDNGIGGNRSISHNYPSLTGIHTHTCFAKKGEYNYLMLRTRNSPNASALFDLANGTVSAIGSGASYVDSKIENIGNGWYKCSITLDPSLTTNVGQLYISMSVGITGTETNAFDGDGTSGIYIWGSQFEENSYATSYIKTVGTTQSRSADTANGAGNASLINSTEGVLYAEIKGFENDALSRSISISDGTTSNRINLFLPSTQTQVVGRISSAGVTVADMIYTGITQTTFNKIAVKWKLNDFSLFVNGVKVLTDSIGASPTGLNVLSFDNAGGTGFLGKTKSLQVYTTALSDSDLEKITSWTSFTAMANGQSYTII